VLSVNGHRSQGDLGEFNQCQCQLKILYDEGVPGHREEFTAYRLLYFILARARSDINHMIATMPESDKKVPEIAHALQVRQAVALGDYKRLGELAASAPNMGGFLMDHFMPRERAIALVAMCKSYAMLLRVKSSGHAVNSRAKKTALTEERPCPFIARFRPNLTLTYIQESFQLDTLEEAKEFVENMGGIITDGNLLDTKASLGHVMAAASSHYKVDIKGQL